MATILVVDDEMGIRELLSEILSDEGHVVEAAENAQAAREYRLNQAPDLVLLDIWMPDTDGITLLREWQGAAAESSCPVVMMSGHGTVETAVEATRLGHAVTLYEAAHMAGGRARRRELSVAALARAHRDERRGVARVGVAPRH